MRCKHRETKPLPAPWKGIEKHDTALILASVISPTSPEHLEVVKKLLAAEDIDINKGDQEGMTALHKTLQQRNEEVADLLLKQDKIDVNAGGSALLSAASGGCGKAVELLLASKDIDVQAVDSWGCNALYLAAERGHLEVVQRLLKTDIDINKKSSRDHGRSVLLLLASRPEHLEILKLLLEDERLEVNEANELGETALFKAVESCNVEAVRVLLSSPSIDLWANDTEGRTAFSVASAQAKEHYEVVDVVLRHFPLQRESVSLADWRGLAQVSQAVRKKGMWSPLRSALWGDMSLSMLMLKDGADWAKDIAGDDVEAAKLAVRLGFKSGQPVLVEPAVRMGTWTRLAEPPSSACIGDLKDVCGSSLLGYGSSLDIFYILLDWLAKDPEMSAEDRQKSAEEGILHALKEKAYWRSDMFLSSGILSANNKVFEEEDEEDGEEAMDPEKKLFWLRLKAWNRVHWCVNVVDRRCLEDIKEMAWKKVLPLILEKPNTGEPAVDISPAELMERWQPALEDFEKVFNEVQAFRKAELAYGIIATLGGSGLLSFALFSLRRAVLLKSGLGFTLVAPLIFSLGGWVLVFSGKNIAVGLVAGLAGLLLSAIVFASFRGGTLQEWMRPRPRTNKSLLEPGEIGNMGWSWVLVAALSTQFFWAYKRGMYALVAGKVNAVASTLPLFMTAPRRVACFLRFLPGLLWAFVLLYDLAAGSDRPEASVSNPSPRSDLSASAVIMSFTCLALAWTDVPGALDLAAPVPVSRAEPPASAAREVEMASVAVEAEAPREDENTTTTVVAEAEP